MSATTGVGASSALDAVAQRLTEVSERQPPTPFARIAFPGALDESKPLLPPELISIYGHPVFEALDGPIRWRLGLLEAVNFFSLNIHGEQALVAVLAERLYRERDSTESAEVSRYLQHFIHEENSHTYMLAEFCRRYYGRVMPEVVFRFESPRLSRTGADLLFFGRVYVLETFLDFVNRWVMRDDTIEPTTRAIHRSHHLEETRHIAFDRAIIATLASEMQAAGLIDEMATIASLIRSYANYAFTRLVNPRIYRELALPDPLRLLREAQASPHRTALKARWWRHPSAFLLKAGLPTELLPACVS